MTLQDHTYYVVCGTAYLITVDYHASKSLKIRRANKACAQEKAWQSSTKAL